MSSKNSRKMTNRIDTRGKFKPGLSLNQQFQMATAMESNGGQAGLKTFRKLKASAGRAKKQTEQSSQKVSWVEEQRNLDEQQKKVEKELSKLLEGWMCNPIMSGDLLGSTKSSAYDPHLADQHSNHGETQQSSQYLEKSGEDINAASSVHELLNWMQHSKESRNEWAQIFQEQLEQARELVNKVKGGNDSSEERLDVLREVVDNILSQIREEITNVSDGLRQDEDAAVNSLSHHRKTFFSLSATSSARERRHRSHLESDQQLYELLRSVGADECPDIGVLNETLEKLKEKRDYYRDRMSQLEADIDSINSSMQHISAQQDTSGWNDFHSIFLKWKQACDSSQQSRVHSGMSLQGGLALSRKKMIKAVAEQTGRPADQVDKYDTEFEAVRSRQRDVDDQKKQWMRERDEILKEAKASFEEAQRYEEDVNRRESEAYERMREAHRRHRRLRKLRQQKIQERLHKLQSDVSSQVEIENERLEQQRKADNHAEKLRREVQQYREQEAEREARIQEEKEEEKQREQERLREQIEQNKPRIRARYEELQKKWETKKVEQEEQRQMTLEQKRRLEELAKEVPYYDKLQDIQTDSDRVQSHTTNSFMSSELGIAHAIYIQRQHEKDKANESRLNEKALEAREPSSSEGDTIPDRSVVGKSTFDSFAESKTVAGARKGEMDKALAAYRLRERGVFHKSGFEDRTIMSDIRSKISSALQSAGLGNSSYAQEVMNKFARPIPKALQAQHEWRQSA
eukprot:gb/GECG01012989.1/.p1 GENE.gb/GECG01012989.1/~~gb/GECG01012989.1/.p1  ORF type:complete len:744 (+),score=160.97 gb/GECG01012989.1/:1-2232(+)